MSAENGESFKETAVKGLVIAGILVTAWATSEWDSWFPNTPAPPNPGLIPETQTPLPDGTPGFGQNGYGETPGAPPAQLGLLNQHPNDPNWVRNGLTGAYYQRAADPAGLGRECYEVGLYIAPSQENAGDPQTVVGAATVIGDPNTYKDASGAIYVDVYNEGNGYEGQFTTQDVPNGDTFKADDPGWKVCNGGLDP